MVQSLAELVRSGRISRDTAFKRCLHPEDVQRHLGDHSHSTRCLVPADDAATMTQALVYGKS